MNLRIRLIFESPFPPVRCLYSIKPRDILIKDLKKAIIDEVLQPSKLINKNSNVLDINSVNLSLDGFVLLNNELTTDLIRNDDIIK